MIEPEWSQPSLSAAEIRAQTQAGAPPAAAMALVPDSFTIQLYNPDQTVAVKMVPGSWGKSDSWEFDLPVQSFRTPTASQVDRENQNTSPAAADLIPKIMFRWKKDGLLSKDMTCYMSGTRLGARKKKEPDITVALFKASRESAVTIYQPNLHRVDVEDRKGLELVLLLGSEVIKDLWVAPRVDAFNVQGGGPPIPNGNKRKNTRPVGAASPAGPATMSGALNSVPYSQPLPPAVAVAAIAKPSAPPASTSSSTPEVDAETRRLQALVEQEKRELEEAERAEHERIKKMIEEEEKERRRREAEVAKETERLRKMYGVEGQDLPSDRPPLPPRTQPQPSPQPPQQQLGAWGYGASATAGFYPPPSLPPRPVSAEPYPRPPCPRQQQQQQPQPQPQPQHQAGPGPGGGGSSSGAPFHSSTLNTLWKAGAGGLQQLQSQVAQHQSGGGRKKGSEEERSRVHKKRSSHW
ncbi:hypothetical protein VTK26DRAFT_5449 [Humicola hyalothermophila]